MFVSAQEVLQYVFPTARFVTHRTSTGRLLRKDSTFDNVG